MRVKRKYTKRKGIAQEPQPKDKRPKKRTMKEMLKTHQQNIKSAQQYLEKYQSEL
jgi:hypothetical protein